MKLLTLVKRSTEYPSNEPRFYYSTASLVPASYHWGDKRNVLRLLRQFIQDLL